MSTRSHLQRKRCIKRFRKKPAVVPKNHEVHDKFVCVCDLGLHLLPKFVILPKSKKSRMARLATFSSTLCSDLTMYGPIFQQHKLPTAKENADICALDEIVTQSGLVNPDHVGWLIDQSTGDKRWGVVADMLFCLFANNYSERPLAVLVLPGHEIKSMLFKSAKRDSIHEPSRTPMLNRTISGLLRHQFMVRNPSTEKEFVFALEDIEERDHWVAMLRVAANLDTDIFTSSDSESEDDRFHHDDPDPDVSDKNERNRRAQDTSLHHLSTTSLPAATQSTPKFTIRSMSFALPMEHTPPESRYMPSSHWMSEPRLIKHSSTTNITDTSDTGPVFIRRNSSQALTKTQDDLALGKSISLNNISQLNTNKQPKKLSNKFWTRRDTVAKMDNNVKVFTSDKKFTSLTSIPKQTEAQKPKFGKLVRKVSSMKMKLKSNKSEGPPTNSQNLGSMQDFLMSGFLKVKQAKKWVNMWCLISLGRLYAYRSKNMHDLPEMTFPLKHCEVQQVKSVGPENYIFKVCHLRAYSCFFAAEDLLDYSQWMMVLKTESRVQDEACSPPSDSSESCGSGSSTMSVQSQDLISSPASLNDTTEYKIKTEPRYEPLKSHDSEIIKTEPRYEPLKSHESEIIKTEPRYEPLKSHESEIIKPPRGKLFAALKEHSQHIATITETKVKMKRKDSCDSVVSEQSRTSTTSVSSVTSIQSRASGVSTDSKDSENLQALQLSDLANETECRSEPNSPRWNSPCPAHGLNSSMVSQSSWNDNFGRNDHSLQNSSFDSSQENTTDATSESEVDTDHESPEVHMFMKSLSSFPSGPVSKFTPAARYDQNVRQVWKGDHIRQILRMRIATLPDRPAIFSRHLPGPNNEGVLWLNDATATDKAVPTHCDLVRADLLRSLPSPACKAKNVSGEAANLLRPQDPKEGLAYRRRSLSAGNLCSIESLQQYEAVCRNIAARDIDNPCLTGYLDRRDISGTWASCWCVLKDSSLYCYSAPIDDTTSDIILLHGYEILRCPDITNKEYCFELLHPEYPSEVLAAESSEDLTKWMSKLKRATQHMSIESLNLEQGASKMFTNFDGSRRKSCKSAESKVKHNSKQQLLQEVLQEKMRLEQSQRRKRKERGKLEDVFVTDNQEGSTVESTSSTPEMSPDLVSLTSHGSQNALPGMEQSLREISHLRQRKASTQLKVESLQRQLNMTSANKPKRRFKLGLGTKNSQNVLHESSSNDNAQVQKQINKLQSELDNINYTLEEKKKVALGDLGMAEAKLHLKHKKSDDSSTRGFTDMGQVPSLISTEGKRNSDSAVIVKEKPRLTATKSDPKHEEMQEQKKRSSSLTSEEQDKRESRVRAHTTSDSERPRPSSNASSNPSVDIDPAIMAQISAFEELLHERLRFQ